MNNYIELRIDITRHDDAMEMETATDILAALFAEEGYESFTPDEKGLTAFIRSEDFSESVFSL